MQNENTRPIIIKRVTKKAAGHHGGAWKVAYADFVTALMAFFLLLWLLSMTEEDKLSGIAEFFTPQVVPLTNIGGVGVMKGSSLAEDDLLGQTVPMETERAAEPQDASEEPQIAAEAGAGSLNPWSRFTTAELSAQGAQDALIASMEDRLDAHAQAVQVHEQNGNVTIDILDLDDSPLFESSSAVLTEASLPLILEVAGMLEDLGGRVIITGHSDAVPFATNASYGNWELSADRANSVRRALVASGAPEGMIHRVSGAADRVPVDTAAPDAAQNRRVSIEITSGP